MRRWVRTLRLAVCGSLMLVPQIGCDGGPSGPGTMAGMVDGPVNLGAVVLEVTGVGIQGFVGQGDTRAFGAAVSAAQGRHRVVLVDPSGGSIQFGVTVDDLAADPPIVTVLFASSTDNTTLQLIGIEGRVEK